MLSSPARPLMVSLPAVPTSESFPGVPLIVNGRDISYAVLEGDWGLGKGVHVQPTVYPGNWQPIYKSVPGHYYPHTGQMPGYGRFEIETPPRNLAQPESFYRSWFGESQPTPPEMLTSPVSPNRAVFRQQARLRRPLAFPRLWQS